MSEAETTFHSLYPVEHTYDGLLAALQDQYERRRVHYVTVAHSVQKDRAGLLFCLCFPRDKVAAFKPPLQEGWNVRAQAGGYPIGQVCSVDEDRDEVWVRRMAPSSGRFEDSIAFHPPDYLEKLREWLELRRGRPLPGMLHQYRRDGVPLLAEPRNELSQALRPAQLDSLRNLRRGVQYIWGPPGTGKTHCVGWAAWALRRAGYRVAVLGPTNVAVDNAVLAVRRAFLAAGTPLKGGQLVRAGAPVLQELEQYPELLRWQAVVAEVTGRIANRRTVVQDVERQMKGTRGSVREELRLRHELARQELREATVERASELWQMSRGAELLATTMYSAQHRDEIRAFLSHPKVAVIIDEAGMVARFALLPLLELLSGGEAPQGQLLETPQELAVVLAGDPRQLSPIYQASKKEDVNARFWLGDSLMEELLDQEETPGEQVTLLSQQSRMDISLCKRISRTYYKDRLETLPDPARPRPPLAEGWPDDALAIVNPRKAPLPHDAPPEAQLVRRGKIDQRSLQVGVRLIRQALEGKAKSVLWLSPFRDQARLARKLTETHFSQYQVRAGTIHTSQGMEADFVLFDPVRVTHRWLKGLFGRDIDIERLLNVGASRGRGQVVVLTNRNEARKNLLFWRLLHDAVEC